MSEHLIPAATAGCLYGLLRERARRSGDAVAFREGDAKGSWTALTWKEALARTDRIAAALAAAGMEPGDRVAVLLPNCVDWVCFDMAAHRMDLPVVALYTHDSPENTAYMINDARPRLVLTDTARRWGQIAVRLTDSSVSQVWLTEPAGGTGTGVAALKDVLSADLPAAPERVVNPKATAALIYTSGTTGNPKGVMLSHAAILSNAEGVAKVFPPIPSDTFLSILPLAHAFERTMGYTLPVLAGAAIAYGKGVTTLRKDLATIRPTVLMGVPRLYESMYDAALQKASKSPISRKLFKATARIGWERFRARSGFGPGPSLPERLAWPVLDRLVARKVGDAFGGRLRVAVSGGADLPLEISHALVGLGVPMVEGYGLSEAGPVITASDGPEYHPGSVGYALPGIEMRIAPNGELQVNSPSVLSGYWQNDTATAETFSDDGWLRTGDLASIDDGWVRIRGRLKQIFVLSNGENVNPRPMEVALEAEPLFDQVCVIGDKRPYTLAILSLNTEVWTGKAAEADLRDADPATLEAQKLLLAEVRRLLDAFPAFQKPRAVLATTEPWSVENGLLTPTLKVKRNRVIDHYGTAIEAIYRK